jgi:LPXTG-site transpeptidase (sortase) family protein
MRGGTGWGASPPPGDVGSSVPAWYQRRRAGRWWIAAIVLLLAAGVTFAFGLRGAGERWLPGPLFAGSGPAPARVSPAARSQPLTLSIPAIELKVPVSELGLNANHTVQVPTNFAEPGWYRLGPSPGQLGSAVILGHVDSYLGPAVFFRLRTLRPGDHVNVTLADGVITHFVVRQVAMYQKANFPTVLVYGSHGYSALQLVTCGGVFDSQIGHYLSNVVVYTNLVSTS